MFYVHKDSRNILVVQVVNTEEIEDIDYVTMDLAEEVNSPYSDVQAESLLDFHLRFGQLSYDTADSMAHDPDSGYFLRITKGRLAWHVLTETTMQQTTA